MHKWQQVDWVDTELLAPEESTKYWKILCETVFSWGLLLRLTDGDPGKFKEQSSGLVRRAFQYKYQKEIWK